MRSLCKRVLTLIIVMAMVIALFVFYKIPVDAIAQQTADSGAQSVKSEDISSVRKLYITNDQQGYVSTVAKTLPYGSVTSLSVSSSNGGGEKEVFVVDRNTDKGVPVIRISNAADFSVNMSFKDMVFANAKVDAEAEIVIASIYEWFASVKNDGDDMYRRYAVTYDTWGKNQTGNNVETVTANGNKIATGQISTGALVVQTSYDGKNWTNVDKEKYANGLYTTNVLENYAGTTQSYSVDGKDIKRGVYVSMSLFYEVAYSRTVYWIEEKKPILGGIFGGETEYIVHEEQKDVVYYNICETYTFFVVEDNPEVVTYNNLTNADKTELVEVSKPSSEDYEEYRTQAEQYNNYINSVINQMSNTMNSGDMTTSGFRINITANPYLTVSLKKDGKDYSLPKKVEKSGQVYYEIVESGKYDVIVKSYSKTSTTTIYVDTDTADKAYARYFGDAVYYLGNTYGDGFIDYSPNNPYGNRRIFNEYSDVPVFKGPLTLNLQTLQNDSYLPLYGIVKNKSTNQKGFIDSTQVVIAENGEYEVVLYTNPNYYNNVLNDEVGTVISGDVRVYTFKFKVVGQLNVSTINQGILAEKSFLDMSVASPSDYVPKFYGVSRTTVNKGRVIIAFSNREDAVAYAKQVVWGDIEKYTDNGQVYWKIPDINNPLNKVISTSGWKNAEAVNVLGERLVSEHYVDMTLVSSYLTMEKTFEEIGENGIEKIDLATLQLQKSVVVWYDDEQRDNALIKQLEIDGHVIEKIICTQHTAVLKESEPGNFNVITEGERLDYFVKDICGIDSYTIIMVNEDLQAIHLNYDMDIKTQIENAGWSSGVITVMENNIYHEKTYNYCIYYIKDGDQTAVVNLNADGNAISQSQGKAETMVAYDSVKIESITEYIDEHMFIKVLHGNNGPVYYTIQEAEGLTFDESGNYQIFVVDRFGNNYSFKFAIN